MQALEGIKVLELSRVLAGPWCGMMLADLGADVIKLEPPEGDDTRGLGPPFRDGLSAYFACCNRNKRSLAIDLLNPASRPLVEALVKQADVLIENYRTGTAEKLGVGYEQLRAINPRLIYCSISGYGRVGIAAKRPGYDFAVQAETGLMSITGTPEGEPQKVGVAVADLATGQNAAIAILAALLARGPDGPGQRVAVSLFDSQLAGLSNIASACLFSGEPAGRYGNAHASIVPYQSFRASDGEFVLTIASEKLWSALCNLMGKPEWVVEPRCSDNAARVVNRDWLIPEMQAIFATDTVTGWLARMAAAGIPAAAINTVQDALDNPITQSRGLVIDLEGVPMIASPLRLSQTPVRYTLPPPALGQHSDEIVRAAGLDPDALRAAGAIIG
jgi:crotonobetainyl-CoA:carnitine CoA-transferase CaiB-like acyl-CoA transferase